MFESKDHYILWLDNDINKNPEKQNILWTLQLHAHCVVQTFDNSDTCRQFIQNIKEHSNIVLIANEDDKDITVANFGDLILEQIIFICSCWHNANDIESKSTNCLKDHENTITSHQLQEFKRQRISNLEIKQLTVGSLVSINSFMSTTFDSSVAKMIVESASECDAENSGVLMIIHVNNKSDNSSKPFAYVKHSSHFADEDEVLFMLGTVFRITDIHYDETECICLLEMELCNELDDDMKQVSEALSAEIGEDPNLGSLGSLFRVMGEYDQACIFYKRMLNELQHLPPNIEATYCHDGLGFIALEKGDYNESLIHHNRALNLKQICHLDDATPFAISCNAIGMVYTQMGRLTSSNLRYNELALEQFDKAFKIWLEVLGQDHVHVAACYNNISTIYIRQEKFDDALQKCELALNICLKLLPEYHPTMASIYHNLGNIQYFKNNYDASLSFYEKALEIKRKTLLQHHNSIAVTLRGIGLIYEFKGQFQEALEYYREANEIYGKTEYVADADRIQIEKDIIRVHEYSEQSSHRNMTVDRDDYYTNDFKIIIVGKIGTGKSSLGNTILGEKRFKSVGNIPAGATRQLEVACRNNNDKMVTVVDTPGFAMDDNDTKKLSDVTDCLRSLLQNLHDPYAVLIVLKLNHYTMQDEHIIQFIIDNLTSRSYAKCILIFTGLDNIRADDLTVDEVLHDEARPSLKQFIEKCNNRYIAVNNRQSIIERETFMKNLFHMIVTINI
ncbi:unnamed protein product [Adineta steineri]|uniref:AIG1-type G domain-containing protein n=1 Tax=Adineta steineri TaxID=433720 RepID=A0A818S6P3_9BILA|nr:unnamed protein product [Adineta steineri]